MGAVFALAPAAGAATLTVNRFDDPDSGTGQCAVVPEPASSCSLREAVDTANLTSGDTIMVPAGSYTVLRAFGYLYSKTSVSINGAGASSTTVTAVTTPSMDLGDAVFTLNTSASSPVNYSISGMTIAGGDQGAIDVSADSSSSFHATVNGIQVRGMVTNGSAVVNLRHAIGLVENTAIIANQSAGGSNRGALEDDGPLSLVNSTIAGNTEGTPSGGGGTSGAGVIVYGTTAQISNSTIVNNQALGTGATGGNLQADGTHVTLRDSIIAGGVGTAGGGNCAIESGATITSAGYNLEDGAASQCGLSAASHDVIGHSPLLGNVQSNGGETWTAAPGPGSLAINGGNPAGCMDGTGAAITTDQRGFTRPQGAVCDIGAVELRTPTLSGAPTVSGTVAVGQTLTCNPPTAVSPDAPATTTIAWLRAGSPVGSGATYTLTALDAGKAVACSVTATNVAGSTPSASPAVTLPATYNVVVTIHGGGKVTVQGKTCTSACTVAIATGTVAAVTASHNVGWAFSSWQGNCSGRGACTVSMTSDHAITATFARVRPHATLTKATIHGRSATFKFKAVGATRFTCALVRRHAKLRFSRCKSPKAYRHLARGHYTFELRAVGPGGTQRAPTIRRFTI
jgi:CSLREA domain-containing protein